MTKLLKGLTSIYQWMLSPIISALGGSCRFAPTCSDYMKQALEKYGWRKGFWRGLRRIFRCHPWHAGGIDLP
ncbi:MAG: membrane protein insertion efficiency factor YidD [Deltaproteobacteria bacterium]|nr:membrane protein insertion efficiency factor YidD [Deltaproteobacteria bacterium]